MKTRTLLLSCFIALALGLMAGFAAVSGYQHGKAAAVAAQQ